MKENKCLFEDENNICTRSTVKDKEACSTNSLLKGYAKCIFLYPKEEGKKILEEEWLERKKLYES